MLCGYSYSYSWYKRKAIEKKIKTYKKHGHSKRLAKAIQWLDKPKVINKKDEEIKIIKKPIQKKKKETYKERKRRNQKAYR